MVASGCAGLPLLVLGCSAGLASSLEAGRGARQYPYGGNMVGPMMMPYPVQQQFPVAAPYRAAPGVPGMDALVRQKGVQELLFREDSGELGPILFKNIYPGPEMMSYFATTADMAGAVCDKLVTPSEGSRESCLGDATQMSLHRKRRAHHRRKSMQCLKDKLQGPGGVFAMACQLCSARALDGIMWASPDRLGRPCTSRYRALGRIASHAASLNEVVTTNLRKATMMIEAGMRTKKSLNEALGKYRDELKELAGADTFMDLDDDGAITDTEIKEYLKAAYIVASVVPEVVGGEHSDSELLDWASSSMRTWLEFDEGFSQPLV